MGLCGDRALELLMGFGHQAEPVEPRFSPHVEAKSKKRVRLSLCNLQKEISVRNVQNVDIVGVEVFFPRCGS